MAKTRTRFGFFFFFNQNPTLFFIGPCWVPATRAEIVIPKFVGSPPKFVGFVAWVHGWVHCLASLVHGFTTRFMVDLLLHVVSALISCLCLCLCFCCFFGCRGFFNGEKGLWIFFKGRRGRRRLRRFGFLLWNSSV